MFVAADSFTASLAGGVFTHFRREEDKTMASGKFEEELKRIGTIVDRLQPDALLLLNESLEATNEREGAEIARQIIGALLKKGIKVFFVTHLYEFARSFCEKEEDGVRFLRAERLPDGTRTYRLRKERPLETGHGIDLDRRIFGAEG